MIISIDGPAGSGKSTVADLISEKLGFIHLNSGSLYRGIAAHMLTMHDSCENLTEEDFENIHLSIKFIDNAQHVFVNDIDYTSVLRNNEVSKNSALVGTKKTVRKIVDECQRSFAKNNNIVIEGRDVGSFVFPNAEFKFYLDCNSRVRAERRFKEEQLKKTNITLEEIENEIIKRDEIDRNRKIAPLVIPKNAIILDSTHLSALEVANKMLEIISNNLQYFTSSAKI